MENNNHKVPPQPVCPFCLVDPCIFTMMPVNFGQVQTIAVICGNPECRKVFGVSFVGVAQQQQQQRLVIPSPGFAR